MLYLAIGFVSGILATVLVLLGMAYRVHRRRLKTLPQINTLGGPYGARLTRYTFDHEPTDEEVKTLIEQHMHSLSEAEQLDLDKQIAEINEMLRVAAEMNNQGLLPKTPTATETVHIQDETSTAFTAAIAQMVKDQEKK